MIKNAYIITKNGRKFNQEGIDHVLNTIRTEFNDTSQIYINQGQMFNDKKILSDSISKNPENNYIIVSTSTNIIFIHHINDIKKAIDFLNEPEYKDLTTWEVLTDIINNS